MKRFLTIAVGYLCVSTLAQGQSPSRAQERVVGCWRADRPLGPGGGVESIGRDQAYRTFVFQDGGRVAFPVVPVNYRRGWEPSSFWDARGDSVRLVSFTGLNGWDAKLTRASSGRTLAGQARYLTDAIVAGAPPTIVPVTLTRIECEATWPSAATNLPTLRPWQRGEYLYSERYVDRPASIATEATFPQGIIAVRALGYDESAKLDTSNARPGVARVVLQFIVESTGRADSSNAKVLASDGEEYTKRVFRALSALRFHPAMLKGASVHQLTAQRFELRR